MSGFREPPERFASRDLASVGRLVGFDRLVRFESPKQRRALVEKRFLHVRLRQERKSWPELALMHDRMFRVTRGVEHANVKPFLDQPAGKLDTTHRRHDDVGDQQMDWSTVQSGAGICLADVTASRPG